MKKFNLITENSLSKTIIYDNYVYRWFNFLFSSATIELKDKIDNPSLFIKNAQINSYLRILEVIQIVLILLFFSKYKILIFYVFVVIFVVYKVLERYGKKIVSQLAVNLVFKDYPSDQIEEELTLYKVCEEYGRKMNILTLVDAIYNLDKIYRFSFLLWVVAFSVVVFLENILVRNLYLLGIVYIIYLFVNFDFVYKRFK